MNRGQWIAVIVALVAGAGLVMVNIDDESTADAGAGLTPDRAAAPNGDGADSPSSDETSATADEQQSETDEPDGAAAEMVEAPPILGVAGDLSDLDGWLQTDATSFADFDGTVRVVQFWTFGCINCRNTLANLRGLYDEHSPNGLEVIGVHTPEFEFEKDPDRIQEAAIELGVTWPIALDTDKTNFRAWQPGRRFWPRTFVLDRAGQIRFDRIGEGAYDELNATVAYLIEHEA